MARDRILLIGLVLWGLLMIVPDLVRVAQPLGSFGFFANNNGLIYDVTGPFPDEASSPAWRAGLRVGDRIDLSAMRCRLSDLADCSNALSVLGGLQYVLPGRRATIDLSATDDQPARQVILAAEPRPSNFLIRAIIMLGQIAGILVIVAAAWLVWTRPTAMSWGFFLYVNWFNPGQVFAFYAILQQWPALLLAQDAAACVAQGAGYAGFLLFVLRVPRNQTEARWRPVERALLPFAVVLTLALIASYGAVFGYATETTTRVAILVGFIVDFFALAILMVRRRTQTPEDYQRVRWVIWGCLIGLPAFLIAELASETSFFNTAWGDFTPSEDVIGLLYLVNGILCLFVFEAVRRPRVVSVSIPLRRVTILGLTLSLPVLLLHHQVERIQESLQVTGLGLARHRGRGRLSHHPPPRRRRASCRALFQSGARPGRARARSSPAQGTQAGGDRPVAHRRAVPRAEADFGGRLSSARTGVPPQRRREGLGQAHGESAGAG